MLYSDFLENTELGTEKLPPHSKEDQNDLREEMVEIHSIDSEWVVGFTSLASGCRRRSCV